MTPSHRDGIAAAKRVQAANEDGHFCDARDALIMGAYQITMELRRIPEHERMAAALRIARDIVANTRESLD